MNGLGMPGVVSGADARIAPDTRMECGVCWHVYDPAEGDAVAGILPGTPFADLPEHWSCPECDHPRRVYLPLQGEASPPGPAAALEEAYGRAAAAMRDLPVYNPALAVEAMGFREWNECWLGIMVTPWFMNVTLVPKDGAAWAALMPGAHKQNWVLPSGGFEFEVAALDGLGKIQTCSLFSPMFAFTSQDDARTAALAALDEVMRVPEPEAPAPVVEPARAAPSRRDLLRGKLAG